MLLLAVLVTGLASGESGVPAYVARPVKLQAGAAYVLPDGSVYIVGSDDMQVILDKFNRLFIETHPGFKFKMLLKGSSTGLGGLTAGVSAFAPMTRDAAPLDLRPFRQVYGYEPADIHIGRVGYTGAESVNPPGVYVNAENPLTGLAAEQVERIFVSGSAKGDLTHWSQLGLTGDWMERAIHVYGVRDNGGFITGMRHSYMNGLPLTRRYEPFATQIEVIKAVAEDKYGIALTGFFASRELPGAVKMVPLANGNGAAYSSGSYEDVWEGRYPYAPYMHVYVKSAPGQPLDPFVNEYLRLILSREGQAIIAGQRGDKTGLVPLNNEETVKERKKLQ